MFFKRQRKSEAEVEAMLTRQSAQINREIDAWPETIAYEEAKEEVRKAAARVRELIEEEKGPTPSLEEGDVLIAQFANTDEGCDKFLIIIESISPRESPYKVLIKGTAQNASRLRDQVEDE